MKIKFEGKIITGMGVHQTLEMPEDFNFCPGTLNVELSWFPKELKGKGKTEKER